MHRTLIAVTLACLAVLGTTGCGAGGSPSAPPDEPVPADTGTGSGDDDAADGPEADGGGESAAPHACDVLTADIAADFMGFAAESGTPTDVTRGGSRFSTCGYHPADANTAWPMVNLGLEAPVNESGTSWVEDAWAGVTTIDPEASPVPGYGEQALWSPATGQLIVMANGWWLSFSVSRSLDPANSTLDDAKHLADLVLPTI